MALAGLRPVEPAAAGALRVYPERRRLQPLSGRGFVSFSDTPSRVAILRPSAPSRLKPIVRPPPRVTGGLVRLVPLRRTLAAFGP